MTWQPPTPPPRPGGQPPYGQRPGGGGPGGPGGPGGQGPGGPGGPGGAGGAGGPVHPGGPGQPQQGGGGVALKDFKEMNYYQLLQVNREAHSTIIRYAYRFLAAMYHPDNSETGDAEKFRIVTEAWRTLSDEGKRAAYDMSLGAQEEMQPRHPGAGGPGGPGGPGGNKGPSFNRDALKMKKTGVSWNEIELRLAVLQILLDARKKRPKTGGASAKMIMDVLDLNDLNEMEFALWYLREKGFVEMGERNFMISANGVDYIVDQLNRVNSIQESATERKVHKVVDGGVPAVIPRDNGGG